MKDGFIKTTAAVPELKVADCRYNSEKIVELALAASGEGAVITVFPELSITGYTCGDLFFHDTLLGAAENGLKYIAKETENVESLLFVGLPVIHFGKLYNCCAALYRGKILGVVPKTYHPNYNEFFETRYFSTPSANVDQINIAGQVCPFGTKLLFRHSVVKELIVGAEICEDLWAQIPPSVAHCSAGATVIVNLSASNELVGKEEYRKKLIGMASASNICGYVYSSAGEGESTTDLVFSGNSFVCENGTLLAEAEPFSNISLLSAEIDVKKIAYNRSVNNIFVCRDRSDYQMIVFGQDEAVTTLTRRFSRNPFIPSDEAEKNKRCELILKMQSSALAKRIKHTSASKVVVGVSGGLDSTLALLVSVAALKKLGRPSTDVLTVTMPCFGTGKRTRGNAEELSVLLNTDFRCVDIAAATSLHLSDIGHAQDVYDVAYENSQARERTQVLMDIANQCGGIVVGTGDLSEAALGWCTYNGDHMSMYSVNCTVPKTLVRCIVDFYADTCKDEKLSAVLKDILGTPVSPELVPSRPGEMNQQTEEILGKYDLHDFFLYHMMRGGYSPKKLFRVACLAFAGENAVCDSEYIANTLKLFYRRFFSQQFKRSCAPDGVKVGSVGLSSRGDWRMPSDASVNEWLDSLK